MSKRIAFLTASEGVEEVELTKPWQAAVDAGHTAELLSTDEGEVQLFEHLDKSSTQRVDRRVSDVAVADYDALVLPGGVANPDALRMDEEAVAFIRDFVDSGKPVAAICHAPWTLVEADRVKGKRLASWPSLQTDIRNGGGEWVDEEVVVDGNLITSRNPDDIPAFTRPCSTRSAAIRHDGAAAAATSQRPSNVPSCSSSRAGRSATSTSAPAAMRTASPPVSLGTRVQHSSSTTPAASMSANSDGPPSHSCSVQPALGQRGLERDEVDLLLAEDEHVVLTQPRARLRQPGRGRERRHQHPPGRRLGAASAGRRRTG